MRLLLLAVSLSVSWALRSPHNCIPVTGDELEFHCHVSDNAKVIFNARNNEYVNIRCEGTNFTCADLPVINFANDLPLPSLMIRGCLPSILPCLNTALQTPSVTFLSLSDGVAPLTSEDVASLGDVQSIRIVRGPEKSIPSSVIQALPSLRTLRITGTQLTLAANVFLNSSHIEYLELSDGITGDIPADAFLGLTNLKTLNIWGNNITEIGVNSLRGLDSLQSLSLMTSYTSRIAAGALAHVPRLQSLNLFRNQIEVLPPGLLYNLTELENITITQSYDVPPLKLHKHSLANLPSLRKLIISDCSTNLPADLFTGCDQLQTLNLSGNKITSIPPKIFRDLKNLEKLDLNRNKIDKVDPEMFAPLRKLKYLDLNRNDVKYLPDSLFSGLRNLNYVSIDHNLLTDISPQAFLGAGGIRTLSLKYNKLTFKSPEQFLDSNNEHMDFGYSNFDYSPFQPLDELKNLYLRGNRIDTIFTDWRQSLLQMRVLDLAENNFSILDATDLQFLGSNLEVDLTHNNITSLILSPNIVKKGDPMYKESTNSILLDDNPLECDCKMYYLSLRLQGYRPLTSDANIIVSKAVCASPENLSGRLFKNVSTYDLNCDLEAEDCPKNCLTCEIRPAYSDLAYYCNSVPPNMSKPETYGLRHVSLRLDTPPKSLNNLELQLLNLSNIGLTEIPFSPSKIVQTIDFSNNNLTRVPTEFLASNTSLYLSNNQFECDCWHSEELAVLKASKIVLDIDLVKCGDKYLSTIDPLELCNNWRAAAVASGTFIALVILVAIIVTIIYKNSHEILVFIIKYGLCPCCFVDDPDDINKEYDVFVSYAHKDRQYLEKLMPKLENEFGLKTCVHYRDWYVGDFIPDQINRSVEKSRKTIIILSNNFLNSAYANMEFRAAHNLTLKEGKNRIILILIEDVSNHEKLSEELKAHMKLNTFLKWEDPRFTERLQRAMPLRDNKKFVLPEVFKQAGEKTVKSGLDVHLNSDGQLVNMALKDAV